MEMLDLPQQSTHCWIYIREAADGCAYYYQYYLCFFFLFFLTLNTQPLIFGMASVYSFYQ